MEFREINRIAQHYKEKARLRVRISAFITPEKRFGDKFGLSDGILNSKTDGLIVLCGIILLFP